MPQYDAGTAAVRVRPSFRGFRTEAERELRAMDLNVDARIDLDTGQADTEMAAFREAARRGVSIGVDADTEQAQTQLTALQRARVAEVQARVVGRETAAARLDEVAHARTAEIIARTEGVEARRAQLDELARLRIARVQTLVDNSSASRARSDFTGLMSALRSAAGINIRILGVLGGGAALAQIAGIAAAAGKASGAAGLIPAAGFAGLAGIGSAAVGLKGIPDAFKEMTKATTAAGDAAADTRSQLFDVGEAQYRLSQSQGDSADSARRLQDAQRDVNTAYRDGSRSLRDMNNNLEDQQLAAEGAALSVQEAAERLQEVQFDPTSSATQRKRAQLDYAESVQRAKEQQERTADLTQDTAEANAKGVQGSKEVTDAKQKVVDATKAQASAEHEVATAAESLRRAQAELNKPSTAQGGLDKELAKLSPNARQLVEDIRALGPAWTEVRKDGQDALTAGLGGDITGLAKAQLPNLHSGIIGINTAINTGLRGSIAQLSTDQSKLDFRKTLDNTTLAFSNAAKGAAPLTGALTKLITVGSASLPQLGAEVDQTARRFDDFIQRTAGSGDLQRWIDNGITSIREMASTAGNLGSSIISVFRAADTGDGLQKLDALTERMSRFLKSVQGQTELRQFFAGLRQDGANLQPILADLPGLLHGVVEGFQLWSSIALPFLNIATSLLKEHPQLVAAAVAAYVGFKTIKPIVDGASTAIDFLAKRGDAAAAKAGGVGKFKAAGAELISMLGSPWTIALIGAGLAVTSFVSSADKGSEAVARLKAQSQAAIEADRDLQKALQTSGGATDKGVLDAQANSVKGFRDAMAANAKDMPGIVDKFNTGLATIGSTVGLGAGIVDNSGARQRAADSGKAITDALNSVGLSNDQLSQKITGSKPEFDALIDRLRGMGAGGQSAARELQGLRDEWALDATAPGPVAKAIQELGDRNRDAASVIDAATNAMERQRQGGLTLEDAQLRVNQALSSLQSSAQSAAGAVIQADGSIDTATSSGQQLYQVLNSQVAPAWEQLTSAAYRNAIQHGQTSQQAQATAQQTSDAIRNSALSQIQSMGYTQTQADTLLQHYVPLSTTFNATFTADTSQAQTALQQYESRLDAIRQKEGSIPYYLQFMQPGITGPQYSPDLQHGNAPPTNPDWWKYLNTPGHAAGGQLPTRGPGTQIRDGFLGVHAASGAPMTRLDGGEWVVNRDSSSKYRRELAAINDGSFPKLPGLEDGGIVGGGGKTPGQLLDEFARSLAGQPYGGSLDCSGLQSQLANVAVGRPPNSGRMATSNAAPWLGALGFQAGSGGGGAYSIGWINDTNLSGGGHMAGTLPTGVNIESTDAAGVLYGGSALGANAGMFNQHSFLQMQSGGPATSGIGGGAATSAVGTSSVINPQAALPGRRTEQELQALQGQAAVDSANSERNATYANPNATDQDRLASDLKYQQAQNSLESSQKQDKLPEEYSLQGIFKKGAGILATGILSGLGLENSILSESNPYTKGVNTAVDFYSKKNQLGPGGGYAYEPKNLPSIVTTVTPQSSVAPGASGAIPGAPYTPGGVTNTPAGVTNTPTGVTPGASGGQTTYNSSGGAEQWRGLAQQMLAKEGFDPGPKNTNIMLAQINTESGGNPNAINLTDSNAQAGHPSQGLLQTIPSTFAAYRDPSLPNSITDPSANMAAALRYYRARYGNDLATQWAHGHGYDQGGVASGIGLMLKQTLRPERVLSPAQTETFDSALPLLESINAATWSPNRIDASSIAPQAAGRAGGNDYSVHTHITDTRVANVEDLVDVAERRAHMATIGLAAAMPK